MARNSVVNLDISPLSVGYSIGGGTTERTLTINGSGNQTFTQAFAGNSVWTMPNFASDNLLGSSAYSAAGTLLYGSGAGTYPTTLAAGTSGQVLESLGTSVGWLSPALLVWSGISGSQTGVAQNGYYVTSGNQALTLPATQAAGTYIAIYAAKGSTGFSIVQLAGQSIQFGSASSTTGAGGSISSNAVGDGIVLLCTTANTTYLAIASIGNLTVV